MGYRIDERKVWKARWSGVLRLAAWLGIEAPKDGCKCLECRARVIRRIAKISAQGQDGLE